MTSCILTITQGDFEYLNEWIEYHHNIGIDLICIGYNGDYKNYSKLPQYDYVKYFDFSQSDNTNIFNEFNHLKGTRIWAYLWGDLMNIIFSYIRSFFKNYIKYVIIIDTDEFLSPTESFINITDYLDNIYDQNLCSEYVHMQFYNGNNHIYYENKPVLERFTNSVNKDKPLLEETNTGLKKSIINLQHPNVNNLHIESFHHNIYSKDLNNLPFNKIVLKHFVCKSLEEWIMKMNPEIDKDYFNRFKGHIFSGWGSYFLGYLNNNMTTEALQAIPILLKKYNISYKPEIDEDDNKFKQLYKEANDIKDYNLNIFIVSTGCYNQYLEWLYPSIERLFTNCNKHIYLISDKNIKYNLNQNIKYDYFHITDLPYPFITYNKVNYICDCINEYNINKDEYFIYLDVDSIILEKSYEYWEKLIQIINENKICFSLNSWGCLIEEHNEENKYSSTYLLNKDKSNWIQASIFFGIINELELLNEQINKYINIDNKNKVISRLNDETVINKIIIDNTYKCNLNHYHINYYKDVNDINNLEYLDTTEQTIKYIDYKDIIFCIQKYNTYIKENKKYYKKY